MTTKSQLQEELDRAEYLVQYWKNQYDIATDKARQFEEALRHGKSYPEPAWGVDRNPEHSMADMEQRLNDFIARRLKYIEAGFNSTADRIDKHQTERHAALAKRTKSLETRVRRLETLDG